ncbi:MAG: tetratricopeptide repeat protein [Candidatus Zixiibacteriota bacterium]|nr:MAG: tetratricopeptide repeat protein [candidate division Zixibacteria bacterium]
MSECLDKQYERRLHAYQLGMLQGEERRRVELHILECDSCREQAAQFEPAAHLIRGDTDVRQQLADLAEQESEGYRRSTESARGSTAASRGRVTFIRVAAVAALIISVVVLKPWRFEISPSEEVVASENRLAVSFFENLTGDPENDRLCEIITNLITTDLSESRYVQVVSSQRLKDALRIMDREGVSKLDQSMEAQVAREVKARWVLSGSVLAAEPQIIITTRLLDPSEPDIIASHRMTGEIAEDVFSLVDRLTVLIKNDLPLPAAALSEPDPAVADVTTHSPEAYRHYLEGLDYISRFYRTEGVESFQKAIELDSSFAMAYYYLARHEDQRYLAEAIKHYGHASRKERFYIRSLEAVVATDTTLAIQVLRELVEAFPDEKAGFHFLGQYLHYQGHLTEAIESEFRALQLDPYYKLAYNQLAYSYDRKGILDSALWAINEYIRLAPDEPNPYDTRGDIQSRNGMPDEAIQSYLKAVEIKRDFHNYRSLLRVGELAMLTGDYERALDIFAELASSDNGYQRSVGRFFTATVALHQGKLERGLEMLSRAIVADSVAEFYYGIKYKHRTRAFVYRDLEQLDQSVIEIRKSVQAARRTPTIDVVANRHFLVQLLAESGRLTEAAETAEELRKDIELADYSKWPYWYAAGNVELAKRNYDSAAALFERSREVTPDFLTVYMLGMTHLEAGNYDLAIERLAGLTHSYETWRSSMCPWSENMYYYLARAYDLAGMTSDAVSTYETFLSLWKDADPGIPIVIDARERLAHLKTTP